MLSNKLTLEEEVVLKVGVSGKVPRQVSAAVRAPAQYTHHCRQAAGHRVSLAPADSQCTQNGGRNVTLPLRDCKQPLVAQTWQSGWRGKVGQLAAHLGSLRRV